MIRLLAICALLCGCANGITTGSLIEAVDKNQPNPGWSADDFTELPLNTYRQVEAMCHEKACALYNVDTRRGIIVYRKGDDCRRDHERDHRDYGPKHAGLTVCPLIP